LRQKARAVTRPKADWTSFDWSISFGSKSRAIDLEYPASIQHNSSMKTPFRLSRLAGWTGRCAVAFITLAFCASAFADPSKNVVTQPKAPVVRNAVAAKKQIYIIISGSAIPQPIDRVAGRVATTAIPMFVLGNRGD
jgi:hypothetical protein